MGCSVALGQPAQHKPVQGSAGQMTMDDCFIRWLTEADKQVTVVIAMVVKFTNDNHLKAAWHTLLRSGLRLILEFRALLAFDEAWPSWHSGPSLRSGTSQGS